MRNMKRISMLVCLLLTFFVINAMATTAADIVGLYEFPDPDSKLKAKVKIYETESGLYDVRVVWMEKSCDEHGKLYLDANNPNKALRTLPLNQILMVEGLEFNADKQRWESDSFYHPIMGRMFSVHIYVENEKQLRVRGYWKKPVFGQTIYWDRVEE